MEIDLDANLIKLAYDKYQALPFKTHLGFDYSCDPRDAHFYYVCGISGRMRYKLQKFKAEDQDKAHQFAELLTECLTKIKAFTDENIETK